jgi:protein required for attachment to host cells
MSNKAWLLICNAEKAYLYELDPRTFKYLLIGVFEHPESHLKDSELIPDQGGQYGMGTGGHAVYRHNDPHDVTVEQFAHSIAKFIEEGRVRNRFCELIFCAEPKFLGKIYNVLPKQSQLLVTTRVAKDYVPIIDRELDKIIQLIHDEVKQLSESQV